MTIEEQMAVEAAQETLRITFHYLAPIGAVTFLVWWCGFRRAKEPGE